MNKLYKFVEGKRVRVLQPLTCPVCKKDFQPKVSTSKYCGRECYYEMKRIRGDKVNWTPEMRKKMRKMRLGKKNPMYGKEGAWKGKKRPDMWGDKHPNYKGGYTNENGYRIICFKGRRELPEHRFIMENHIGRELTYNEVVHHKNGDKLDNRLENLQLMTRAEHINEHREDVNNSQPIFIKKDGLVFMNCSDAMAFYKKSKTTIYRWIKEQ